MQKQNTSIFETQLSSYGLTVEDAELLGIEFLDAKDAAALYRGARSYDALKINYFDTEGNAIIDPNTGKQFYRLRYIAAGPDVPKYIQEPGSVPTAYYPRNVDWSKIAGNVDNPVIITEGEMKAARCGKDSFACVGLGGVFNFAAKKEGVSWIPTLNLVHWTNRHVYVVFDSDLQSNKNVAVALQRLTAELKARGAIVHVAFLPELPGNKKTGLDDFLNAKGKAELEALLADAEPLNNIGRLLELNNEYCRVDDIGAVYKFATRQLLSRDMFLNSKISLEEYTEKVIAQDGSISLKKVNMAKKWFSWPQCSVVDKLDYAPGKEQYFSKIEDGRAIICLNLWRGWAVEPREGDVTPFLKLVDHLFSNMTEKEKRWFLQWISYPLQYPGAKLYTAVMVYSRTQGIGKSLIGETIGRIYGENYGLIENCDLHANFSEWAIGKCFCQGDEISSSDKRKEHDSIKNLITKPLITIRKKYVSEFSIDNKINFYFTTNHPDALPLEDDDRRFFIVDANVPKLSQEFYSDIYVPWMKSEDGPAALLHYLLNYDTSDFDPAANAPRNKAKEEMTFAAKSGLDAWALGVARSDEEYLPSTEGVSDQCDLMTSADLFKIYTEWCGGRTTANAHVVGKVLKAHGVRQANGGGTIHTKSRKHSRYFIVRNVDKWMAASHSDLVAHIDECYANKYTKF